MKYVSPKKKQRLSRLAQNRWKKQINRKRRKHVQEQKYNAKIFDNALDILENNVHKITAPTELSLSNSYFETIDFVNIFRSVAAERKMPTIIDLSQVDKIGVAAALLLVSEIDRVRRLGIKSKIIGIYPKSNSVRRFMKEVGFFDLIQVKNPDYESEEAEDSQLDFIYIKFKSGSKVDNIEVKNLRIELEKLIHQKIPDNIRQNFFESLAEAMTNATEHAYGFPDNSVTPRIRNRWWMSAAVNHSEDSIMIALFDQGIGIPFHLRTSISFPN